MATDTTGPSPGHVGKLIAWSAANPYLVLLVVAAGAVLGWSSLLHVPLDAIPDLSEPQVVVLTEWSGQSPDLVDDQITFPISTALLGSPGVKFVRGQSFMGLSFVYVIFEEGTDLYWARSRIQERLAEVRSKLPGGVHPRMGPDASGVGWVLQYALVDDTGAKNIAELRAIQDWNIRYALESVAGVAEVATVGGMVKQYQVEVDPNRLSLHGLTLNDVTHAVRASNSSAGGSVMELAGHDYMVRSHGYLQSAGDLRKVPVSAGDGLTPILLGDVANIGIGPQARRGIADLNGKGEVVGGIVVMRHGENALYTIDAVKERMAEVVAGLPAGVRVEWVYDRSGLIRASVATLRNTLTEEALVVSLIILLFLLHARSALVVILTLPVAVLLAFIPIGMQGISANIMSLGGIAVAMGALIDGSIVVVENIHRRVAEWEVQGRVGERRAVVIAAMQEVGPSIFFSLLVITCSFLPLFALNGIEGRLFHPLVFTKTYSMAFGALLAVTLTPALAVLLIRGSFVREEQHPIMRRLVLAYIPVVRFAVRERKRVIAVAMLLFALTVPVWMSLESEFMPALNEGDILYMPSSPPGMSITEAGNVLQVIDSQIAQVPEVESVFGKAGRADTATDPAPLSMVESVVVLKPQDQWRDGMTWEKLVEELDIILQVPGMPNLWWMPIQTRVEMLSTGIRSPLAVQVFGDDPLSLERAALQIEELLRDLPGTRSIFAERLTGGFYLDIDLDRVAAASLGVRAEDVSETVRVAIGGLTVTETIEGRQRFPVSVRYAREIRDDPDEIGRVLVPTLSGSLVPLSSVATIHFTAGPAVVRSESGRLVSFVFIDPGERAIGGYVHEAQQVLDARLHLPEGVRLAWAGQYEQLQRATQRMFIVVPFTLILVLVLLYLNTRSIPQTLIVLAAVPFSLIGAVWMLWFLDYHISVAVWVGLIALAGLDAETGVVMLLYLTIAHRRRCEQARMNNEEDLCEAIVEGAAYRLRPKLMTVLCLMLGLLPLMWSDGAGADVMKRIAAPLVGGLLTSFLLELAVYPSLFAYWKSRSLDSKVSPSATDQ